MTGFHGRVPGSCGLRLEDCGAALGLYKVPSAGDMEVWDGAHSFAKPFFLKDAKSEERADGLTQVATC